MNKLYLIGNSHIDPVWQWKWQDGITEVLATFRSVLDRMNEFPDFKYTSACALYYMWVERLDPEMFGEIQERVKEGRWNITGGWYIQPDCNIPCGESFARQGLISQRYFKEKFGITATSAYNVDSFGHNASLPQIFKKSGMDNYVFMRPQPNEKDDIADLFIWESADGSRVLAHRITERYNIALAELDLLDRMRDKADKDKVPYMAFYGVGNHGGGPTIKLLDEMSKRQFKDEVYATVDEYFEAVKDYNLPVVRDELQHHARGCYSAGSFVKKGNRKCENNLLTAEKFSVLAKELTGFAYPHNELNKAWKNVLFNQFHDIMGGCSLKAAYDDAGYLYGETMSITEDIITFALQKICKNIDTLGDAVLPAYKIGEHFRIWEIDGIGTPVVIFNPHCYAVREVIQLNDMPKKIIDENGNEKAIQYVRGPQTFGNDNKGNTVFSAYVPAYGYVVYRLFPEADTKEYESSIKITENSLENSKIKVEFDRFTGDIKSFYLKDKDEYIINSPCSAILLDESRCDTWAHDCDSLGDKCGVFTSPEFKVTESGPVRAKLCVRTYFGKSVLTREYVITEDSDEIRVRAIVDFHEKHRTLKFTFPISGDVISEIPYGTIKRGLLTGEEPCGSFTASGRLGIANSAQHGYDTTGNELRLTILRSCIYLDHDGLRDGSEEFMEQGIYELSYSVFPFSSKSDAVKRSENLNISPRTIVESFHKGTLPLKMSCFHADCENAVFTAIKESEECDGKIIRFYESEGKSAEGSFKLFDRTEKITANHNEIKTLKIKKDISYEVNLIEWEEN